MAENHITQSFRLRIIPATLCWVIGAIFVIGTPFIVYHTWNRFPIEFPESRGYVLLCYLSLVNAPCAFIAGLLIVFAGNHVMRGKWPIALLQCGVAFATIAVYESLREAIHNAYY